MPNEIEIDITGNVFRDTGNGGGFGTIFGVPGYDGMLLKKYKPNVMDGNEPAIKNFLDSMIMKDLRGEPEFREICEHHCAWPVAIAMENDACCGFFMRKAPRAYTHVFHGLMGDSEELTLFSTLLADDETRAANYGQPPMNALIRYSIVKELLRVTSALHGNGIIIGDVSYGNILVSIDSADQSRSTVFLLDADSMRIEGGVNPIGQPYTPDFYTPEWGEGNAVQNYMTDVYKICLCIFRLYYFGPQRTAAVPSADDQHTEDAIMRMAQEVGLPFATSVVQGLGRNPDERPTSSKIYEVITNSRPPRL